MKSTPPLISIQGVTLNIQTIRDYISLTKPRINGLVLVTTFLGAWMAVEGSLPSVKIILTLLGTGLTVAGASVFNCYQESDVDSQMERTQDRPLPAGRLATRNALIFGVVCSVAGLSLLVVFLNLLSGFLALLALVVYAPIYTWMKNVTSLSTLVGAVPGALPPVIGWAAIDNSIGVPPLILFSIMFVWQPPHFLALALSRKEEYDEANLAMLPVEMGDAAAVRQIVVYSVSLLPLSLLPGMYGLSGETYFMVALLTGLGFLVFGFFGLIASVRKNPRWKKGLFVYSIVHLTLLFGTMFYDPGPKL